MKKINFIFFTLFAALAGKGQLVNNGGTITVQPGATLFCSGNLTNTTGTITNNGKIEVQGNFVNSATYTTTTNDDSLILSGAGNTVLTTGGSTLHYLVINKAANTDVVKLGSPAVIASKLDYLVGTFSTDYAANPSYFLSAPVSAVFNIAAGREISGRVRRTGWVNGSSVLFNNANMQIATNGGTAPSDITVLMLPQASGGDPSQAERELKRKFTFTPTGGSGYTADIRFPYLATEINTNTEGNLVPWHLNGSEWNARLTPVTRNTANDWVAATGITATQFVQEWKLADPNYTFNVKAYLRGAWNGATLNTALNAVLPKTQPYNMTPFNYTGTETVAAIPANVVDWVLVELRKPASGAPADANASTVIGRKAGFLKNDGTIVDLDGTTPIRFDITKQGASFITVRHRNHLGVMSKSIPSNAAGSFANDFSVLANAYKNPVVSSQPLALLSGGSVYGLWAGDANRSGNIAASDVTGIKNAIANGLSGYQLTDINMTGNLAASDVTLARAMISQGGQGSSPARTAGASKKIQSHIPDPVTE